MKKGSRSEFEKAAEEQKEAGLLTELWSFLESNKKWWLLPIIIMFLVLGALILLSGTGIAPFIYTLF